MRYLLTISLFLIINTAVLAQADLKPIKVDNQWCYINTKSQVILRTNYDFACEFYYNLARVKKNDKWGYIDTSGYIKVPIEYEWVEDFKEGFGVVNKINKGCLNAPKSYLIQKIRCRERYGFADTSGNVIMTKYSYVESFKDGYSRVFKTPWWKLRWNYNIDWKKIDKDFKEFDIPE